MEVLRLCGDPYRIGRGLGARAASVVRDVVFNTEQFRGLRRWLGGERLARLEAAARRHFPDLLREIEGIADGAGVAFHEAFLWNCRGDFPDAERTQEDACTTILLPAADGRAAVIGHNEDGAPEFAEHGFLARMEPENGIPFTAFCYPGMIPGHAFGFNDAGLIQTINHIRPHDLADGVPRQIVTRAVLGCRDLDEALALLRRKDRASGFHHNLGVAASGRILSVEAPASGCVAVEIDAPSAHTNHLIRPAFSDLPQTITPSSAARQERAEALLAAGAAADGDPLPILFDRAREDLPILCRGETGSSDSYTLATVVFRFGAGRLDWSLYHGPERAPVHADGFEVARA